MHQTIHNCNCCKLQFIRNTNTLSQHIGQQRQKILLLFQFASFFLKQQHEINLLQCGVYVVDIGNYVCAVCMFLKTTLVSTPLLLIIIQISSIISTFVIFFSLFAAIFFCIIHKREHSNETQNKNEIKVKRFHYFIFYPILFSFHLFIFFFNFS